MTKEEDKPEEKIDEVLPEDEFYKKQKENNPESNRILDIISLILGAGAKALKMDKNGMWFGAVKFADALLKMDMDGNLWARGNVVIESWTGTTTNNTPLEIYCGSNQGGRLVIKPSSVLSFVLQVVARDDTSGDCAIYHFKGGIKRDAAGNTVLMTTTKDVIQEDDASWDVVVTADNTNESLKISVTGDSSNTVKWAVRLDGVEVNF